MHYVAHLKCKFVSHVDRGKGNSAPAAPATGGKKRKKSEMMLEVWDPRNNSTSKLHAGGHKCVGNTIKESAHGQCSVFQV